MIKTEHNLARAMPLLDGIRVRVFDNLEVAKVAWLKLERDGVTTVYQSYGWCTAWLLEVAPLRHATPVIVLGEDAAGKPVFLLPLQMRRKAGIRIVESLTAPQGAYGGAIFAPDFAGSAAVWFANHLPDIIGALPKHEVFRLADVPVALGHVYNPLLSTRHFAAANRIHIMGLQANYQALLEERRSAESRRSMRKRDAKLEAVGHLIFGLPQSGSDTLNTIAQMFADQERRLSAIGVRNVFDATERRFIARLSSAEGDSGPLLRPYRLMLDGKTLAVMLGAHFQNTYWALVSSLAEGAVQKYSPGDYALRRLIQSLCEDKTAVLDFSAGDTAYKHHWSDRTVDLKLIVQARNLRGMPVAGFMVLRESIKRIAKNTPALQSLLYGLRRMLAA
jgi:CelD/BcsL family acetyltransferase involved in cellulose biosynthesis